MADRVITIIQGDRVAKTLKYDVGEELNAAAGDQVTWKIKAGSGVAAITAITDGPNSHDLFKGPGGVEPHPINPQKTEWQGTLSTSDQLQEVEEYSITWCSVGGAWNGANVCGIVTDPKIRISLGQ